MRVKSLKVPVDLSRKDRSPGLLQPIRASFDDAVKALLGTPLADNLKGSRNVNPRLCCFALVLTHFVV